VTMKTDGSFAALHFSYLHHGFTTLSSSPAQHSCFVSFFPAIGFSIYQWLSPIAENRGDTEIIYQAKGNMQHGMTKQ